MMTYIAISFTLAMTGSLYPGRSRAAGPGADFEQLGRHDQPGMDTGRDLLPDAMWRILSPVVAIALFQLAIITMTRSLETAFNPRLRTQT